MIYPGSGVMNELILALYEEHVAPQNHDAEIASLMKDATAHPDTMAGDNYVGSHTDGPSEI